MRQGEEESGREVRGEGGRKGVGRMRNHGAEGVDGVKTRREFSHTETRSNQSLLWCGFCLKELEKTKWQ